MPRKVNDRLQRLLHWGKTTVRGLDYSNRLRFDRFGKCSLFLQWKRAFIGDVALDNSGYILFPDRPLRVGENYVSEIVLWGFNRDIGDRVFVWKQSRVYVSR